MNTEFHFDFTKINEEDQMGFLLGDLRDAYNKLTPDKWKGQLWEMTVAVSSDTHGIETQSTTAFDQFIAYLKELIVAAWSSLQLRNRTNYKHEYLSMPWSVNPYAIEKENLSAGQKYLTSHLRNNDDKVTVLTREEAGDFFLVFEGFFRQLDVISWPKLLDVWLDFAESDPAIVESGYDYTPLETYRQLLRLIEACYLADRFAFAQQFYAPNEHLFELNDVMLELYTEMYDGYNPFLQLSWLFIESTLPEMRNTLAHWMECARNKEKIYTEDEPATLISFFSDMCKLLEIGWLISHTGEMPTYWLNPKQFDPDGNQELVNVVEEEYLFLSKKERRSPRKALIKFHEGHSWFHYQRIKLKDALYYALNTKVQYHNADTFNRLEESMGKLMEILYLINREFHLGLQTKA